AVIVPGGSKGGFIGKQLPSPSNREAWVEAGKDAYRAFIRAMLDITDNRDGTRVVPPAHVVRHDDDDPYLVVAADKGTAAFSDVANDISQEYGFWLDDAFASGGSTGYDHKAMGITARGAWESAKRHFRELSVDIQNEPFTVVGIGDMSGDVFGNGMRQSRFTRLIAAFDHRHVFIDPDPDPHTSFEERERLYHLPSSSWADYNPDLISPGGGVFERGAKAVTITQQMRQALGLADDVVELTPTGLIRAALQAPVDLIYNGGIGTYIKASSESHADIGDPAGDEVRVDAADLRTRVIVEGGNLGVSQRGRVEAARSGIAINTDAIDNSGGVVSSDVEVNLKLLFTDLIKDGVLTTDERNQVLQHMTDEVADQVVSTNYEQNVLLSTTLASTARVAPVHQRMIAWLEERGDVDRDLEALPSDDELRARWEHGEGLTRPELAAIVAYAKLSLKADLEQTSLAQDPWFNRVLAGYFPTPVRERFAQALLNHPLRDNLIINQVANAMINHGGMTFSYRVVDETGAELEATVRAFMAAQEIFQIGDYAQALRSMSPHVPVEVGNELAICSRRVLDRVVRWLLAHHPDLDVEHVIATYAPVVAKFRGLVPTLMVGDEKDGFDRVVSTYTEAGV
ncbi:MAG TPA: NAD-glutamate dehydrogenase domain-containing protein, partial [Beutenbergiaceae bacterium]|nr:NAD-glutamate dehydrogenase domain-containing protein [Beutenbergiaceae bacterium]